MWEVLDQLPSEKCSKELLTMSFTLVVYGWSAARASRFIDKSQVIHVLEKYVAADVLRHYVSRNITPRNFFQSKVFLSDPILDPKIRRG